MRTLIMFAFLLMTPSAYGSTLIHAGTVIDGQSNQARPEVTIVISNGLIDSIQDGFLSPGEDDEVVDLSDYTVLPGLMDMHTHLAGQMSKTRYTEKFFMNPTDSVLRSTLYAERTLMAGFTTVRDLGDDGVIVKSLRDAVAKGWILGPRIFTAGKSLATTGGHADPTNGISRELQSLYGDPGPTQGVINSPDEARQAVRQRYKDGSDLIKLTATGGVLSLAKSGQNPQFTQAELEAVVSTAKDYGFTVAVHAHGAEGMKRAIRAGVTSIEHGTLMDAEAMDLMKKHGTYYVPTILAGAWVAEKAKEDGFFPEIVRPKAAAIGPEIQKTFAKAYKAGVKIAFGTDSGVSAHGGNAREFELMVEGGMPEMETLQAATMEAAKLLRIEDTLGSLEPGKIADIIAVAGNPLKDITVMHHVVFVMKDGKTYKRP
jgi:imidazolonepropionase-like amidohydrolase